MDIRQAIKNSVAVKNSILDDNSLIQIIDKAAEEMIASIKNGGKVLFCGNGGSAADAQHTSRRIIRKIYIMTVILCLPKPWI